MATILKFFQNPFMFLELLLCISNHTTMMLNLTQDLAMLLKFVSRRLFPFWWLQLCTVLSIVFTGENIFQQFSHQIDTHPKSPRNSIARPNIFSWGLPRRNHRRHMLTRNLVLASISPVSRVCRRHSLWSFTSWTNDRTRGNRIMMFRIATPKTSFFLWATPAPAHTMSMSTDPECLAVAA